MEQDPFCWRYFDFHCEETRKSSFSFSHVATQALSESSIVTLDLSWNSLGNGLQAERSTAESLRKALEGNCSLTHLNVAHGNLDVGAQHKLCISPHCTCRRVTVKSLGRASAAITL
jgi:hypothetical protein